MAARKQEQVDFESLREHGQALREAAGELRVASQQALADAEGLARSEVRERPYLVLGVAFAAGWVLGGGVPVRLATLATGAVGRAALGLAAARLAEFGSSSERPEARDKEQKESSAGRGTGARAEG